MASLLDLIRAVKVKKSSLICMDDLNKDVQEIADLLPKGEAFVYGNQIFIPSEVSRQLASLNKLYARCLITKIREIQPLKTEEEADLISELFSLLPVGISLIVINNQTYHCTGNKKAGEIITEEEIISKIIDD